MQQSVYTNAGMYNTALRLVTGWTYFSAFWRRLVLDYKLNPDEAGYIGEKFNHFLPNALGIGPLIEYLVSNPDLLHTSMMIFTITEGIAGLLFMAGLFTRLMSMIVMFLASGILLGAGWLGTTCLDEWQIGVLGIAAGFGILLSGGGRWSLDHWLEKRGVAFAQTRWFRLTASGALPAENGVVSRTALTGALMVFGLTLFTNQYFHGGVYGRLHNKSVKPHVIISAPSIHDDTLTFTVFRTEGADVYGSFLIGIDILDEKDRRIFRLDQQALADMPDTGIKNDFVARVRPGRHSLILPLGARARLSFTDPALRLNAGSYTLRLTDISGITWEAQLHVSG